MKKFLPAIVIGVLAGLVGSTAFLHPTKQKRPVVSTIDQQTNTSLPPAKLRTWEDPAGFTFEYPEGVTLNPHEEDQENYAHIEFTSSSHPGRVIVWARDIPPGIVSLDQWVKTQKNVKEAPIIDTTLLNTPAKKILIASPTKKLLVATFADDLLFLVEGELDEGAFWASVHDVISRSMVLAPIGSLKEQIASDSMGEDAVGEGEIEVIE